MYAVVYGPPARTEAELSESVSLLDGYCEEVVTAMRRMPGADASREEPAALRAIYHRSLVGEGDDRPTGREITETAHSLAPLVPSESIWEGAFRPHTLFSTPSGRLIGFDLYDRAQVPSPLVLIVAAPGGGKSVLMARTITDVLGSRREARVRGWRWRSWGWAQQPREHRHHRQQAEGTSRARWLDWSCGGVGTADSRSGREPLDGRV